MSDPRMTIEEIRERVEKGELPAMLRADAAKWADATHTISGPSTAKLEIDAANTIEALRARLASAEEALRKFGDRAASWKGFPDDYVFVDDTLNVLDLRKAAAHFSRDGG